MLGKRKLSIISNRHAKTQPAGMGHPPFVKPTLVVRARLLSTNMQAHYAARSVDHQLTH